MIDRAPWTRPATAWALDHDLYPVACPETRHLVGLVLADSPLWLILVTITDPDALARLIARIMTRDLPDALIDDVYDALVKTWTGWSAWITERLWTEALETWQVLDSRALTHGVDIFTLAPDRATTLVYGLLAEHHQHDKDHGQGWDRTLRAEPLPLIRRRIRTPDETAAADWQAMQGIFTGMRT